MRVCWLLLRRVHQYFALLLTLFLVFHSHNISAASVDIVKIGPQYIGATFQNSSFASFKIRWTNDTGDKWNCSHAWRLSSPDGATWDSVAIWEVGNWPSGPFPFKDLFDLEFTLGRSSSAISGIDTVTLVARGTEANPSMQLPSGWSDSGVTIEVHYPYRSLNGKHLCIDSCSNAPGATWEWSSPSMPTPVIPQFLGLPGQAYTPGYGYCFVFDDGCPVPPMVLNSMAACETPFVDPNITAFACGDAWYDFDGCRPCAPGDLISFEQVSGPGATNGPSGFWSWDDIPSSAIGHTFNVQVIALTGLVFGDPVSMTVTIQSPVLDVSSGFLVITLKTGQSFNAQMSVTPATCSDLSWSFHQFAGDPSGQFSLNQSGQYSFTTTTAGLYTYMVNISNGVVSDSVDPSFIVHGGNCCAGPRGNVNNIGIVDLSDLSLLVSYLTTSWVPLGCFDEANINGLGIVDLTDLSTLVSYLTGGGAVLPSCP